MKKILLCISLFALSINVSAQNKIDINAAFNIKERAIQISQFISYKNESNIALDTIYLNDWNNSYSTKNTPLARRFAEEYNTNFHFAKNEERGFTSITSITSNSNVLQFDRLENMPDVIKVNLAQTLQPNESYTININYLIQLPSSKFTDYGITSFDEIFLKYWYITPAVFDGTWHYYSNKDLNDLYIPKTDITIQAEFPRNYLLTSELELVDTIQKDSTQSIVLHGKDRINTKLFLTKFPKFKNV